ncbi:hypothetical protein Pelo_5620 [Pelomyxa schiedti]|nr:hypothetical protein Pelo_5620 [Pelomyxa schiedti]
MCLRRFVMMRFLVLIIQVSLYAKSILVQATQMNKVHPLPHHLKLKQHLLYGTKALNTVLTSIQNLI